MAPSMLHACIQRRPQQHPQYVHHTPATSRVSCAALPHATYPCVSEHRSTQPPTPFRQHLESPHSLAHPLSLARPLTPPHLQAHAVLVLLDAQRQVERHAAPAVASEGLRLVLREGAGRWEHRGGRVRGCSRRPEAARVRMRASGSRVQRTCAMPLQHAPCANELVKVNATRP